MAESLRIYTYKNRLSTNIWTAGTGADAGSELYVLSGNDFNISADTTSNIGKINSFVVSHVHTGGGTYVWNLKVRLTLKDGTSYDSDVVSHSCNNSKQWWENTLTGIDAAKFKQYGIASITLIKLNPASGRALYVRSDSTWGYITANLNFDTYVPQPPNISGSFTNSGIIKQYVTNLLFIHSETYDSVSKPTAKSRVLRIYDQGGTYDVRYTISTASGATSTIAPVGTYGSLNWQYTVVDTNEQSTTISGTVSVVAYATAQISTFSAKRSSNNTKTVLLEVSVTKGDLPITKVEVAYVGDGNSASGKRTLLDNSSGQTSYNNNNVSFTPISDSYKYFFDLIVTDTNKIMTTARVTVNPVGALLNIEKTGVAIGKLVTNTNSDNPTFEVAWDMTVNETSLFQKDATFMADIRHGGRSMIIPGERVTLTISKAGFSHWTSYGGAVTVERLGPLVFLNGGIVSPQEDTVSYEYTYYIGVIATLPAIYCPRQIVSFTQIVEADDTIVRVEVHPYNSNEGSGKIVLKSNKQSGPFPMNSGVFLTACWIANEAYPSS